MATVPFSTTADPYPTFWFDFPYARNNISSVRLMLLDSEGLPIATAPVTLEPRESPGLFSTRWPETEAPLEQEQSYRWFLLVDCQSPGSTDAFLEGMIRRLPLPADLEQQLSQSTARERVFLYARHSFWHEALTELARLRQADPADPSLANDWADLLESVDLPALPLD